MEPDLVNGGGATAAIVDPPTTGAHRAMSSSSFHRFID